MSQKTKSALKRQRAGKPTNSAVFDKYDYYRRSVQGPDNDVLFLRDTYKELRGKEPSTLREDFCGTFAICCEWVKLANKYKAIGIDLDPEPIGYGKENYLTQLLPAQQARIEIQEMDVLNPGLPKSDIIAAMNFSHYIFKERAMLKAYFDNCHATLKPGGILITDCFGGSQCYEANEEETEHKDFSYFWDQESFDPITNFAMFHIHFKPKGKKKIKNVFSYDWRMWSIPELREIMKEAGFRKTHVYWEGTTKKGEGDGIFKQATKGEDCQAWIAYVVAEK
jgi:SAM-dependent methyltransferase